MQLNVEMASGLNAVFKIKAFHGAVFFLWCGAVNRTAPHLTVLKVKIDSHLNKKKIGEKALEALKSISLLP